MRPNERINGQVFLVLELVHDRTAQYGGVSLVASIPGREGTLTRRWGAPYGIITTNQLADLQATVSKQVGDGVVHFTGAQEELEV